jgi:hypothetical protein
VRRRAVDDDDDDDVIEHQPAAPFNDRAEDDDDAMAAESSASEASFEESASDAGAAIAPSDDRRIGQHLAACQRDAYGFDCAWRRRQVRGRCGDRRGSKGRASRRATLRPCRRGRPTSWSRPGSSPMADAGSAALETPRFELRSAPVDEIATGCARRPASSVDAAP